MGFLNNTTVTVDAILTKKGRELLAQGTNAFNITKFALADDEVDYRLWDTSHPNGTDYYGTVIENMPLLEAFSDENHIMRYKLVTLPKNTQKMPVISVQPANIRFTAGGGLNQPSIVVTPTTANETDQSYTIILHDQSVASMVVATPGGGAGGGGATTPFFLSEDDVPNSKTIVAKTARVGVVPLAASSTTTGKTTNLTIVGNDTGATTSISVSNEVILVSSVI